MESIKILGEKSHKTKISVILHKGIISIIYYLKLFLY